MTSQSPAAGSRRPATLQVDVDDLWVYQEASGRPSPIDSPPRVYEQGVPRLLDMLDRYGIRATFFVCGRDLPSQTKAVAEMARRGHEVANHATTHPRGFARLNSEQQRAEILTSHQRILAATGSAPVGFKSPAYSIAPNQLELLTELGYRYDSSVLATLYAPVLRLMQRWLSREEIDATRYGRVVYGLAPLRPYRADKHAPYRQVRAGQRGLDASPLWEVPVTTIPIVRLPMHSSFVLAAGTWLFDVGLAASRARRVTVNYSLHAAEFIDSVNEPGLAHYKFLVQPWEEKRPVCEHILQRLSQFYDLMPTRELLEAV